jgi:hypothetical protein
LPAREAARLLGVPPVLQQNAGSKTPLPAQSDSC